MNEVRLDCEFCDETIRASEAAKLKDRSITHLGDHRSELREMLPEVLGGESCRNDCGYVFPTSVDEVAGFECPDCGRDNFESCARRYLYWRIER